MEEADGDFNWEVSGGEIAEVEAEYSIDVDWDDVGEGRVALDAELPGGCEIEDSIGVTVMPEAKIQGPQKVCEDAEEIEYQVEEDAAEYSWQVVGGEIQGPDDEHTVKIDWGEAGSGQLALTSEIGDGCEGEDVLDVTIEQTPDIEIQGPKEVSAYKTGHQYEVSGEDNYSYFWNVSGGELKEPEQNSTEVIWEEGGTGTLEVTANIEDAMGYCADSGQIEVEVSSFDPDFDGLQTVCGVKDTLGYSFEPE